MTGSSRLGKFAWATLGYTLLVIVWGAFVRASFSGDGCGTHWPFCNGEIIPIAPAAKTWVEFGHRVSSGLILPIVVALAFGVFKRFPRGSQARRFASLTVFFTLTEAAVGAKLVLHGLVTDNDSLNRVVWMASHLTNTFLLLACMALTAWCAAGGATIRLRGQGAVGWGLGLGLVGVLILGISGAVTALGDQLFKAGSFLEGVQRDFAPMAHFLERYRLVHPLVATSVGLFVVLLVGVVAHVRPSSAMKRYGGAIVAVFATELMLGIVNMLLMAPIWMQLVHLLVADAIWILLVLAAATALSAPIPAPEKAEEKPGAYDGPFSEPSRPRATVQMYVALTKPRVVSLLLFTTVASMFVAKGGWPGGWLLTAVTIGGYMAAGAANAINMVFDSDIDLRMKRTASRPTVTHAIPASHALAFALALAAGSVILLTWAANFLCAMLAMAGLLFYVVIYTMMLKRRTWHNIVIGGAAGAFPPLVGYSAVTGNLSPLAWILFAIIFAWTPVHFWALALLIKDDYADAGIPMLPVVHGDKMTVIQIGLYSILTAIVSVLPLFQGQVGYLYFGTVVILNVVLALRSFQLFRQPDRPHAVRLFKYSMVYLAVLFLMIAIDRAGLM